MKLNAAGAGVAAALKVLLQVFNNISAKSAGPQGDPKFRRLRLQNPKINEAIVDTDGGIETLQVGAGIGAATPATSAAHHSLFWHVTLALRSCPMREIDPSDGSDI